MGQLQTPWGRPPHQQPVEEGVETNAPNRPTEGSIGITKGIEHPDQHITGQVGRHAQAVGHQQPSHQSSRLIIEGAPFVDQGHKRTGQPHHQGPKGQHAGVGEHQPLADAADQLGPIGGRGEPGINRQQRHQQGIGEQTQGRLHQEIGVTQARRSPGDAGGEEQINEDIDLQHP